MTATLPTWQCHKRVQAAKILAIGYPELGGKARLTLTGGLFVEVGIPYLTKHQPEIGGYYVRYEDGYESFSPAEAFEHGYALTKQQTLQSYLIENDHNRVTDFRVRASVQDFGRDVRFYIHPNGKSDETLDFRVLDNALVPL